MSAGPAASAGGAPRGNLRRSLALAFCRLLAVTLALAAVAPVTEAVEIALQVRANGRIDLRVSAAPLSAVLDRLASETGIQLVYQGNRPEWLVSLEVYGSDQAQTVLEALQQLGMNYAVSLDAHGTRVRKVVIDDPAPAAQPREPTKPMNAGSRSPVEPEPATDAALPEQAEPPVNPAGNDAERTPVVDGAASGSEPEVSSASGLPEDAGFPLLPGDYLPGGRANRQTPAWGLPDFELPDPPDGKAPSESPSEPDRVAPTPQPTAAPPPAPLR